MIVSAKPVLISTFSNFSNTRKTDLKYYIEAVVVLLCWTLATPDLQYN